MILREATPDDFSNLAAFISPINVQQIHQSLHCSEVQESVYKELLDFQSRNELRFVLALEGVELVGALGGDCDDPLERLWLWGPFVKPGEDWSDIAQQLYAFLLKTYPEVKKLQSFDNVLNQQARDFYKSNGFREGKKTHHEYFVSQSNYQVIASSLSHASNPVYSIIPYEASYLQHLDALHQVAFPDTYYTTKEMIDLLGEKHRIYLALENKVGREVDVSKAIAYIFANIQPEGEGFVHFLYVDSQHRKQGLARLLMSKTLSWFLEEAQLPGAKLVVSDENNARHLYEQLGFKLRFTGIAANLVL